MANNFSIKINGKSYSGILKEKRIKRAPKGKFVYNIRHSDNDESVPATLEPTVKVNFFGTFISDTEVPLMETDYNGDKYSEITDWDYLSTIVIY